MPYRASILLIPLALFLFLSGESFSFGSGIKKSKSPIYVFDCPTIVTAYIHIQPASCNKKDGGIYGISGTGIGVHSYTWYNSNNMVVGTDSVLSNVPAGTYTVKMRDESKCPAVLAGPFTINTITGINFDESRLSIKLVNCANDGAITGIKVTGAATLQWISNYAPTKALSTTADLLHVPIGFYTLKAFNAEGCQADSRSYYVDTKMVLPTIVSDTTDNPTCMPLDPHGDIIINIQIPRNTPVDEGFHLIDDRGNDKVYGKLVYTGANKRVVAGGLGDGTYTFLIGDPLGCFVALKTYTLKTPVFSIDTSKVMVYNDHCGQHAGVIGPAKVIGGTPGKLKQYYKWLDAKGHVISNQPYALNLSAGRYMVHVDDIAGCAADSPWFTVLNLTSPVVTPVCRGNSLCLPGETNIYVVNLTPGYLYRLYQVDHTTGDTSLLTKNTEGRFTRPVAQTTTFFVTGSDGTCESPKTKVSILVEEPGVNIPNLFTPNRDGINDFWNITGLANYPGTLINVYDRAGQVIYTSIGYTKPFDGTRNGLVLPQGTYYYTIDLKKKSCGAIAGSVTILR